MKCQKTPTLFVLKNGWSEDFIKKPKKTSTVQSWKLHITDAFLVICETFFEKWSLPLRISSVNVNRKLQKTADLVTFTEEILNGKLHFLCSGEATMKRYSIDLLSLGCEKKIPDPSHSLCTAYLHNKQLILYLRQTCTLLKFWFGSVAPTRPVHFKNSIWTVFRYW